MAAICCYLTLLVCLFACVLTKRLSAEHWHQCHVARAGICMHGMATGVTLDP